MGTASKCEGHLKMKFRANLYSGQWVIYFFPKGRLFNHESYLSFSDSFRKWKSILCDMCKEKGFYIITLQNQLKITKSKILEFMQACGANRTLRHNALASERYFWHMGTILTLQMQKIDQASICLQCMMCKFSMFDWKWRLEQHLHERKKHCICFDKFSLSLDVYRLLSHMGKKFRHQGEI